MHLDKILKDHDTWARSEGKRGRKAVLTGADLRGHNFSNYNLSKVDMSYCTLSCSQLKGVNLSEANLSCTNLNFANLHGTDLRGANLGHSTLSFANLYSACLTDANLQGANLFEANIRDSYLGGALINNTRGLTDPSEYLADNFEYTDEGLIVYKLFGVYYLCPARWLVESNSVIEEVTNCDRRITCGQGINVATMDWLKETLPLRKRVWKCLIRWKWLPGVIVPYATDGKIRCSKLELLEEVDI